MPRAESLIKNPAVVVSGVTPKSGVVVVRIAGSVKEKLKGPGPVRLNV
jgi:hypothetical protein